MKEQEICTAGSAAAARLSPSFGYRSNQAGAMVRPQGLSREWLEKVLEECKAASRIVDHILMIEWPT